MINFRVMRTPLCMVAKLPQACVGEANSSDACEQVRKQALRPGPPQSFDGPARLFPGAKTAANVRNGFKSHALRCLGREGRAQTARTKKYEFLVLIENRLVVWALRINPELQHSTGTVESAGHPAVAFQFADIADVDQYRIFTTRKFDRFVH